LADRKSCGILESELSSYKSRLRSAVKHSCGVVPSMCACTVKGSIRKACAHSVCTLLHGESALSHLVPSLVMYHDRGFVHRDREMRVDVGLGGLPYRQVRFRTHQIPSGAGDYVFVAKAVGVERVLPFLCERKEAADLAASFRDGRWHTQLAKLRRACAALRVPRAHLLLEGASQSREDPPRAANRRLEWRWILTCYPGNHAKSPVHVDTNRGFVSSPGVDHLPGTIVPSRVTLVRRRSWGCWSRWCRCNIQQNENKTEYY
jgi:hypothetical protein